MTGYNEKHGFDLVFNDQEFTNMQYHSQIVANGAQNIDQGIIVMNEHTQVLDGFLQYEEFKAAFPK